MRWKTPNVIERDASALAVARMLVASRRIMRHIDAEPFVEVVSERFFSSMLGGRSFTLGALVALLQPSLKVRLGREVIPVMVKAAELAIGRRSLLNPEFGLIMLAKLSERFHDDPFPREALSELIQRVQQDPQNSTVLQVAHALQTWLPAPSTLNWLFSRGWIDRAIFRPLPSTSIALFDPERTSTAVSHVLAKGLGESSTQQIRLADQFIRLRAGEVLERWLL